MKFKCPSCNQPLLVEAEMAGKIVRCPACDNKLQIPEFSAPEPSADSSIPQPTGVGSWDAEKGHEVSGSGSSRRSSYKEKPQRAGWVETDPTNPNPLVACGIGVVVGCTLLAVLYVFNPPGDKSAAEYTTMQWLASLFFKHALVAITNTIFFCWAMAILYLKVQKLRHQRRALMLDVLPMDIGRDITTDNVGQFIDHLYGLPHRLRDSLMVNRIRKALELFETRPSREDVSSMMGSQSDIDSARIGSSFTMVKAFLWAIPILGFIGTVIGLSHAIGGMNFSKMNDLPQVIGTLGKVTGGLGTAFDATLLGLVLALLLNFPMNAMIKAEDDNLNEIDAFCNEVLLPRLDDGSSHSTILDALGGDTAAFVTALSDAMGRSQKEFLDDLSRLTAKIDEQAMNLDRRADAHATQVATEFSKTMIKLREDLTGTLNESVSKTTDYIRTLASGLQGLNNVLRELGEKQVIIQQVKKRGLFG